MKTIKKTLLHYQKGTSNKVYNVYLIQLRASEYLVNFEYGRYASTLREGTKTSSGVTLERAQKLFDSLVVSKMNKDYIVKEGYDSTKQEEKKERKFLTQENYKKLLLNRLNRAGSFEKREEHTTTRRVNSNGTTGTGFSAIHNRQVETIVSVTELLTPVDNYKVSNLIYKAGKLNIVEAKEAIVRLYNNTPYEKNTFYYSVTWALGRFKDNSLRKTIESLREKLDESSRYIVEEALFLLKEEKESSQIRELTLPKPFSVSFEKKNREKFINQVSLLEEMVAKTYNRYKNTDSWYEDDRKAIKNELMPLLTKADEIYLKLYILGNIDTFAYELLSNIIEYLPLTEFNFSLFRRLYKMADMRDDYEILAKLITKIESKKMACYEIYEWNSENKRSLGCSRLYFKKRSLRQLDHLSANDEEAYIDFAKNILLSVNTYEKEFEAFKTEYYDDNWNLKTKKYDAYAVHLTFMKILFGAGQRYMMAPSKKVWEVANKSIKDEVRPELHKELWDKHSETALDILSESKVAVVQKFAFVIVKDHPEVINNASLEILIPLLSLHNDEAREFFFTELKERYVQKQEEMLLQGFLLSNDDNIAAYGLEQVQNNLSFLLTQGLVVKLVTQSSKYIFIRLLELLENLDNSNLLVTELIAKLLTLPLPLTGQEKERFITIFRKLHKGMRQENIAQLFEAEVLSDVHRIGAKLIRCPEFENFAYDLALKEKIANYDDHQMLATTIYLLGKLSDEELIQASEMLVEFLYYEECSVYEEASKIIERLAKEQKYGEVFIGSIVEKSFTSASENVANNVEQLVKKLENVYATIEPDQLFRMLIAKSKLAIRLGGVILTHYKAVDFSVVQWSRMAKNSNKNVRFWAYDAYMNHVDLVKEAMPKSLMIFDSAWEDTRAFASGYFESFKMSTDEIVLIADSNYVDVQAFAKKMIEQGAYDTEVLLTKLSQHPAHTIQKFVTDLMLAEMSDEQLLKMEHFFNTLLHSVNHNRIAKNRVMLLLKKRLENLKIAKMVGRLATHHSATMVWADKELYVEMMSYIVEHYEEVELPLNLEEVTIKEVKKREVV